MSYRRKLALSLVVLSLAGGVTGAATYSAFVQSTANQANSFSTGTVAVSDDDDNTALLTLSSARPGDSATGCIRVTFDGSLDSNMKLYASSSGSLVSYLDVTVTRGTSSGSFPSCTGFNPDGVSYIGAGNGIIYSGALSSFPTSASAGPEPTAGSPETWVNGESHVYQINVKLQSSAPLAAQGLSGSVTFTWAAQNL